MTCEKRSGSRNRVDADRPAPADAREVVAAEVDEHHVLGAVLLGGEQPLGVALAGLGRAGDRVQARRAVLALDERLRRGADQREVAELEQEEVRRRVDAAERAVELERGRGGRPLGALREDDLEGVAGADVAPCPPHAVLVARLLGVAPHARCRCGAIVFLNTSSGSSAVAIASASPGEHLGHAADVVEADERVGDDEAALGKPGPSAGSGTVGSSCRDVVVGEVADDAARRAPPPPRSVTSREPEPTKRVAAEPPLLDRLEQEARRGARAQAQVRAERGDQVGRDR